MKHEKETSLYQMIAVGCLFLFIVIGWKYIEIKKTYQKAETEKVYYCQEYYKAMCYIELFLESDTTKSNISFDTPNLLEGERVTSKSNKK